MAGWAGGPIRGTRRRPRAGVGARALSRRLNPAGSRSERRRSDRSDPQRGQGWRRACRARAPRSRARCTRRQRSCRSAASRRRSRFRWRGRGSPGGEGPELAVVAAVLALGDVSDRSHGVVPHVVPAETYSPPATCRSWQAGAGGTRRSGALLRGEGPKRSGGPARHARVAAEATPATSSHKAMRG